jgi:reverse gyrase
VQKAQQLVDKMSAAGHKVEALYGKEMSPEHRDRILEDFREGKFKVLISTNVLSRGIDILQVSLVVNYDLPMTRGNEMDHETYLYIKELGGEEELVVQKRCLWNTKFPRRKIQVLIFANILSYIIINVA